MNNSKVKIDPQAIADIKSISEWYDQQQSLLGDRFQDTIIKHINKLENAPIHLLSATMKSVAC